MGDGFMRVHGGFKEARIDLSVNTNPLGPPKIFYSALSECINDRVLEKYPDYSYKDLRSSLAKFYRCSEEGLIPTAGAGEAINLAILATKPRRIVVVEPSYGEYEDISKALGIEYKALFYDKSSNSFYLDFQKLNSICEDEESLVVITNPNNPTGYYIDREELFTHISKCKAKFLIDEAYMELCSKCPVDIGADISSNIVVVRTLTKWLSVPGIRLGFLYTSNAEFHIRADTLRQPWNVNSLAECIAQKIFNHGNELRTFINESRQFIDEEKRHVTRALSALGLKVFESSTNFLLVEISNSWYVVEALKSMGIAVRSCASFKGLGPNYIRVAIGKSNENSEFLKALAEVLKNVKSN